MTRFNHSYSEAKQNENTITANDRAHDRKLIEDSFNSGVAPKGSVEAIYKKYVKK